MNGTTDQKIRDEQNAYARSMENDVVGISASNVFPMGGTLHARKPAPKTKTPPKVSSKGHEAFLKALEASGATVTFDKASSDTSVVGKIKHSDKYTVSVVTEGGITRVLFKHDISEFHAEFPVSIKNTEV